MSPPYGVAVLRLHQLRLQAKKNAQSQQKTSVPKKPGSAPSGFGQQHTTLENTAAGLGRGGRPQTLRSSRSQEHGAHSSGGLVASGNAFERLNRTLRAGLDPFQVQDSTNLDGIVSEFADPPADDYFGDNPYLLSPDFAARERTRRRVPWRRNREKYDYKSDHELQDYGVYGNRYEPVPSYGRGSDSDPVERGSSGSSSGGHDPRRLPSIMQQPRYYPPDDIMSPPNPEMDPGRYAKPKSKKDRHITLPPETGDPGLSLLETQEPNVCVILDFGENATFASQDLPSPSLGGPLELAPKEWASSQLGRQRKLFSWVRESRCSGEGMLLMNVERHCQFPFVTYLVLNTSHGDPRRLIAQLEDQVECGQTHEDHHIAGYEEVFTIGRPPVEPALLQPKISTSHRAGYIISAFRVFPGEDRAKLERSWLTWTGARQIFKRLPAHLGLKRISFHKKVYPDVGITYVLICECTTLMDYVTEACCFVDQLRARCCGYTALYRVADYF